MDPRAGTPAQPSDLIDVDAVVGAYYDLAPDVDDPAQKVVFGTSGHRGRASTTRSTRRTSSRSRPRSSSTGARRARTGRCSSGATPTRCRSRRGRPRFEVLVAAGVRRTSTRATRSPDPAVSQSILLHNEATTVDGVRTTGPGLADGIVVTPSHNPRATAASSTTRRTAARRVRGDRLDRGPRERDPAHRRRQRPARAADPGAHVRARAQARLPHHVRRRPGERPRPRRHPRLRRRIGADPLGGASVEYWGEIGERYGLDLTVVNPQVDPAGRS